jgi:hypothetical protein
MSIIERAEDPEAPEHFQNSEQMAEALARLPPSCLATEGEVGYAVRTLLRSELELRRAKLKMVERSTAHSRGGDDSTRFFKTDAILRRTERITAKPPPPENAERLDHAVSHRAGAPREERTAAGSQISKVQSDSDPEAETCLMFLASPKQQGAGRSPPAAQRAKQSSRDEMTQIFRPLFASDGPNEGGHPKQSRRSDAAPVASMCMLPEWVAQNQTIALNQRPARRSWSARTRADPWMALSLLLAVLLVLVVWLAGSR